jgi:hypothetical protein
MDTSHLVLVFVLLLAAPLGAQVGTPPPSISGAALPTRLTLSLLEASEYLHGLSSLALEEVEQRGLPAVMEGANQDACADPASTPEPLQVACLLWITSDRYTEFRSRVEGGAFFPVRSHFDAVSFWKEGDGTPEVLRSGSLLLEEDFISTDLEILSDLIGSMRVGLGVTVVSEKEKEEAEDQASGPARSSDATEGDPPDLASLSRLANTGGTVHLTGTFPVFYRAPEGQRSILAGMLITRVATESPALGGYLENPAMSGSVGFDLTYYRPGFDQMIDIEFGAVARGYAFNPAFQEKIGADYGTAGLFALRAGIVIARRTMLSITWRVDSSELFREQADLVVSLQTVRR